MKVWPHLSAAALLTLISIWGLSGCSKQETAATKPAIDRKEPVNDGERVQHGEPKEEVHAKHDGHKKSENKDHKDGEHQGKALTAIVKIGDKVPDVAVRTLEGKSVTLGELRKDEKRTMKGVVVLAFWCTTCHSCRHMETALAKLSKDYEGQAAVLALDANANESVQDVVAFVKKNGLALSIVLDPSGHTADLFGIQKTTMTLVIDGNGVLRYCGQFRQKGGASAEEALKSVLAGQEVAVTTTPHKG